jgi:hypothetical protein
VFIVKSFRVRVSRPAFSLQCQSLCIRRGCRARARTVVTNLSVRRSEPAGQGQDDQDQKD